jgi:hypothetical protein
MKARPNLALAEESTHASSFLVISALTCVWVGCGEMTNVDDLFRPTPTGGKGARAERSGGTGARAEPAVRPRGGAAGVGGSGGSTTGGSGGGGTGGGGTGGGGMAGIRRYGRRRFFRDRGTGGTGGTVVDSGADVRRDAAVDARDAGKGAAFAARR